MHRARDKLFACACFARDEQGRVRPCHALDETKRRDASPGSLRPCHRSARTTLRPRADVSLHRAKVKLRRPLNPQRELLHLKRLREEIMRAHANRRDGHVEITQGRRENDRHIRTFGDEMWTQLKPTHAAHAHVGDDGVEVLFIDRFECGLCAGDVHRAKAATFEFATCQGAHRGLVFDDENVWFELHGLSNSMSAIGMRGSRAS